MKRYRIMLLYGVLSMWILAPRVHADDVAADKFAFAMQRVTDGERVNSKDPAAARVAFVEAAGAFQDLAPSPMLWPRDQAVAWLQAARAAELAGDLPHAIRSLRRAELIDPALPGLAVQLQSLRERITKTNSAATPASAPKPSTALAPPAPPRVTDTLRALANAVPTSVYLLAVSALAFGASALGGWALATRRSLFQWPFVISAAAACGLTCIWAFGNWPILTDAAAVVHAQGVVARTRPGYEAPAAAGVSLFAGTEIQVHDSREVAGKSWIEASLRDPGLTPPFWIPTEAILRVAP